MARLVVSGFVSMVTVTIVMGSFCDDFCYPGMSCHPKTDQQIFDLRKSLSKDADVYTPSSEAYRNVSIMYNIRVTKAPYLIVMATTVDDVVTTVKYANKYNMRLTIRSSGHDYIGRSTGDGTIQVNLSKMKGLRFDLNSSMHADGVVTAQSGNTWIRVYEEASKRGRVIVGGSAHTVSMGGYTLGGGHAPIVRKFGLAVDNLLEVEMVTADGNIVYANANETRTMNTQTGQTTTSSNTDLFWALRGGGGSTFGIVTEFTYKLHMDSPMVIMSCFSPFYDAKGDDVGTPFWKAFNNLLTTSLAPEWGGYHLLGATPVPQAPGTVGSVVFVLNHFGKWGSPSFNTILPFMPMITTHCEMHNVSNFFEYENTTYDAIYITTYIFNRFMQPDSFTDEFYSGMIDLFFKQNITLAGVTGGGCTGALIGGNSKNTPDDDTAVSPYFRNGVMSLSCGISWDWSYGEAPFIALAEDLTSKILRFGKGTYFNEPSAYLPDWKNDYWGGHYDRLLAIKQVWDPTNVFSCHHCVGSDLKRGFNYMQATPSATPHHSAGGIPAVIG